MNRKRVIEIVLSCCQSGASPCQPKNVSKGYSLTSIATDLIESRFDRSLNYSFSGVIRTGWDGAGGSQHSNLAPLQGGLVFFNRRHATVTTSIQRGYSNMPESRKIMNDPARTETQQHSHAAADHGPPPDPPGMFATISAMTAGGTNCCIVAEILRESYSLPIFGVHITICYRLHAAFGAIFVSAVGVIAVFKMAVWVARETGHSLVSAQTLRTNESNDDKVTSREQA